ncbi:polyribonucleotide nucleotidyltransferase 2, mitochondrial-like [Rutidosis leptorrhynchoides]|uniref:polyribonucleotide nucleotidyltransferase 2, mitochondrial-like n=1 Tax=Rutidosis leptorrhynchoides TaxID=125765 RepID=UPI003A9A3531
MDFKIEGTRNGITAIQLDIKPAGIPLDIVCESLEHAYKGRLQILERMEQEISAPRTRNGINSLQLATLKYSNDDLRHLIGPLGASKMKIEEETVVCARMSVRDGELSIIAKNKAVMEKVQEKVDLIIGRPIEIGGVYKGIVTSIKEYGAFVELNGGKNGLLHVSELSHEPVAKISDVVSVGQKLSCICIGLDLRGNIKLSLKAATSFRSKIPKTQIRLLKLGMKVTAKIREVRACGLVLDLGGGIKGMYRFEVTGRTKKFSTVIEQVST